MSIPEIRCGAGHRGSYLDLARTCLQAGDEDRARDAVVRGRNLPNQDAASHRAWGAICEDLGMARQAQESYERSLRLNAEDSDTRLRLAVLFAEVGHYEKSLDQLKRLLQHDPGHQEARRLLAENYRALGLAGQAEALNPKPPSEGPSLIRYFPPAIGARDSDTMLALFAGREVGYAVQEITSATGEVSHSYREAPLTHELIQSHLLGELSLAGFPLRSDNAARYGAVEVRLRSGVRASLLKNPSMLQLFDEKIKQQALHLNRLARQFALPAYLEQGGDGAWRLWFFFKDFVHFLQVKSLVITFLAKAPATLGDIVVEPLLATRPVGIGWIEQAIALPFGLDRGTLRRSLFVDERGIPFPEQLKALRKIRPIPLRKALEGLCAGCGPRSGQTASPLDLLSASAKSLCRSCSVIRELVQRAFGGRILRREEKVALFYSLGLADHDGDALHRVLEATPDYDHHKVERQRTRLQPNPVSCIKIRELLPELTASLGCHCDFDLRGGKYPSPLLHINPHLVPTADAMLAGDTPAARDIARRYLHLIWQMAEISKQRQRLENLLEKHLDRQGCDQVQVDGMQLRRRRIGDCSEWEVTGAGDA